jgi:chromosome partitioning protein
VRVVARSAPLRKRIPELLHEKARRRNPALHARKSPADHSPHDRSPEGADDGRSRPARIWFETNWWEKNPCRESLPVPAPPGDCLGSCPTQTRGHSARRDGGPRALAMVRSGYNGRESRLDEGGRRALTETIALINMKGGVGKTTLAVNLAWHSYLRSRKNVLLVDLDPQFNASQYLMDFEAYRDHVQKNGTIADLLIDSPTLTLRKKTAKPSPKKVLACVGSATNAGSRFDLLPAELALSHVVKNPAQMEYRLEKLLESLRNDYDYVFIDCAPTDSVLTTMTLTASDYLLIPVRPDRFSILGFGMVLDTIRHFREKSHDPHGVRELGVVFTQVHDRVNVEHECMDEIRQEAMARQTYIFQAELGFSPTFVRAVQDQTPAFQTKFAREELKSNITALTREMHTRIAALREETE